MSVQIITHSGRNELNINLTNGQRVYLLGQCNLKVVDGTVDVMGYRLEPQMSHLYVCSPKSFSLVCILAVSNGAVVNISSVTNNLASIEKMQSSFLDILSHSRERPEDIPGCWVIQSPHEELRFFEPGQRWDAIGSELAPQQRQVVFVCGNRKVGKSTFCRYLVNRMLNYHKKVAFIDFDCGQAEFTPPGFVAFSVREGPFTSPNFVNLSQQPTQSRFYGSMNPSEDPKRYLSCCVDLWDSFITENIQAGVPVVINMLGWISGLGLALHSHLLHVIKPTHILAFGEDPPTGEDYVSKALFSRSGFPGDTSFDSSCQQPAIAYIPNVSSLINLKISPADSRSLSYWSYFFFNRSTLQFDFGTALSRKQPFGISVRSIAIHFLARIPESAFWSTLNCSLVALAIDPQFVPGSVVYQSAATCQQVLGLGFIRGVNPKDKTIHLVTPIPIEALSMCNTLIVGALQLPPAIFTQGQQYEGPYLSFVGNSDSTGAAPRKVRHNIIRNRQ